jgi:hypothetical protein
MKKEVKKFPRNFRSSSAAYRAIYQYEARLDEKSGLIVTKIDTNNYLVSKPVKMSVLDFNESKPNVSYDGIVYRYYPDGLLGGGYYEQKTGDRRRPNSKFLNVETVYTDFVTDVCV